MLGRDSSGAELVIMLTVMFVIDPVYGYVRRKLNSEYPRYQTPTRAFRILAFAVPPLTILSAVLFLPWSNEGAAYLFYFFWFVIGCILGRYFLNRSKGRPAYLFGGVIVEPDDPEFANDLWDLFAVAFGSMLVLLPAVLSLRS
jgi:uncharacterized membrane protein